MKRVHGRAAVVAAAILWLTGPVFGGVVFEVETKDHDRGEAGTTEVQAEGKNLKMSVRSGESGQDDDMIFRGGDRPEMVVVDHSDESFMVLDGAALEQVGGQIGDAMAEMKKALESVPENQRALVEKMMKERGIGGPSADQAGPTTEVRRTDEKAEKLGYPCVRYDVFRDGQRVRELWVTPWSKIEGGEEAEESFSDMADFFKQMMDSFSDQLGGGFVDTDNVFAEMAEIDGFPVVTRDFDDDGSLDSETSLRSARRRTLDPDAFEPPAGYKRRSMFPGN